MLYVCIYNTTSHHSIISPPLAAGPDDGGHGSDGADEGDVEGAPDAVDEAGVPVQAGVVHQLEQRADEVGHSLARRESTMYESGLYCLSYTTKPG